MFFFGKKKAEPDRTKEEAAPKADKDGLLEKASELIRKLDTVQDKKDKSGGDYFLLWIFLYHIRIFVWQCIWI